MIKVRRVIKSLKLIAKHPVATIRLKGRPPCPDGVCKPWLKAIMKLQKLR